MCLCSSSARSFAARASSSFFWSPSRWRAPAAACSARPAASASSRDRSDAISASRDASPSASCHTPRTRSAHCGLACDRARAAVRPGLGREEAGALRAAGVPLRARPAAERQGERPWRLKLRRLLCRAARARPAAPRSAANAKKSYHSFRSMKSPTLSPPTPSAPLPSVLRAALPT